MALTKVLISAKTYPTISKKYDGNEIKACMDVKKKYFDDFSRTKDLHFFLGTTLSHHYAN